MLVGNKERFGIEFERELAKSSDPSLAQWEYGRIRWWCGGEAVGNYEPDTTLRDVAIEAERFLAYEGQRRDDRLIRASRKQVARTIAQALFDDRGQTAEQVQADEEKYRRFLVTPQVDVFDQWDIFLVDGATKSRLIWGRVETDTLGESELRPGEFERVLRLFQRALRGDSTHGRPPPRKR